MTAPEELVVTPEMRQAVYAADCKTMGHMFDVKVGYGTSDDPDVITGRPNDNGDDTQLPHLYCRRCQRIWMVVADAPSSTYEEAEMKVASRMKDTDSFVQLVKGRQKQRQDLVDRKAAVEAALKTLNSAPHSH